MPRRKASPAVRSVQRALRRATLRLRFVATPLHGRSRRSKEINLGRTMAARRSARFAALPAQTYSGLVRYRWVRGKRTVRSGFMRTRKSRAAGRRGSAFCTLRTGRAPRDVTPPFVLPVPSDGAWRRGPLDVQMFAVDDLSGVAGVFWQLGADRYGTGRTLRIESEGVHQLWYAARDRAGNDAPLRAVAVRVDMGPPTVPTIAIPSGSTVDSTPELRWNASRDSGSGVHGYWVLVRNVAGAIVFTQPMPASAPRSVTIDPPLPLGHYGAEVIAVDGAGPEPWSSTARSYFAVVAPHEDADGDGVANSGDQCPDAPGARTARGCPS